MNLDDLKSDWTEQNHEISKMRIDTLAANVVTRVVEFETRIYRRDLLETVAAAVVFLFFGCFLWYVPCPMVMQLGIVIIMLATLEVVVLLHWTRRQNAQISHDLTLREYCVAEITRVDRQIRLLRNVSLWYSGPLMLGCCVMIYGLLSSVPELPGLVFYGFLTAFYACFLAAGYIIHRGNAKAVDADLMPIRSKLEKMVRSLESEE